MKKIAVFASGSGSNAQNLVEFFKKDKNISIDCILANKPDAFVLERAKNMGVETFVFNRKDFYNSSQVLDYIKSREIDFVVLAGFLWLIPSYLIDAFPGKIVNIHPALLPKYGGKGMFGMNVHKAVVEAGEKESGITIHFVNENYDEGNIIFQAKCPVEIADTPENVAEKVHQLEYIHFPRVVKEVVQKSV